MVWRTKVVHSARKSKPTRLCVLWLREENSSVRLLHRAIDWVGTARQAICQFRWNVSGSVLVRCVLSIVYTLYCKLVGWNTSCWRVLQMVGRCHRSASSIRDWFKHCIRQSTGLPLIIHNTHNISVEINRRQRTILAMFVVSRQQHTVCCSGSLSRWNCIELIITKRTWATCGFVVSLLCYYQSSNITLKVNKISGEKILVHMLDLFGLRIYLYIEKCDTIDVNSAN